MSRTFSEAEQCARTAKGLRELADRIEAQSLVPTDFTVENETEQKRDWETGIVREHMTGYRRLYVRLFVKPPA
jgi:hypothetical protein